MLSTQKIYDRWRPQTFAEVVGQDKIVAALTRLKERSGFGGRAFWISGATGTGKTTIARLIAAELADNMGIIEIDAGDLTPDLVRQWEQSMHTYSLSAEKTGRAYILNEAHGLRAPVIRKLLTVLEALPGHVAVIFTTTSDGQDKLSDEQIDAAPLLSRCLLLPLAKRGLAEAFAKRVAEIAQAEGLGGVDFEYALALAREKKNNFRAMLEAVECPLDLAA